MSFVKRARRMLAEQAPAALDYGVLVATLETMQSASAAARAEMRCAKSSGAGAPACEPLVEILLAAPAWPEAIAAQEGCFNPEIARPDEAR